VPEPAAWSTRPARPDDHDFIVDMGVAAFNWRPVVGLSRPEWLDDPQLAIYADGWGRKGDLGVIAEADTEISAIAGGREQIGAAWLRQFSKRDRSFGYLDAHTPELTIAVVERWRRRGVGRALLRELFALARSAGVERISLSVEEGNFASGLYRAEGFETVSSEEGAETMVKDLKA
jgi:ribosomal protein S18 acetylase RimI-like enzyme